MRRKTALVLGAVAGFVAVVILRRRRRPIAGPAAPPALPAAEPDPRAEALRRRLDEVREAAAAPGDEPDEPPADEFEAMRRRVRAEARSAAEEMRRRGAGPGSYPGSAT